MESDPVLRNNAWYESNDIPWFDTSVPAIQQMTAAVTKYYPGMVNKPFVWSGGSNVYQWASGILLSDAVKAGGLTASGTPSAAEIVTGLNSLKGDTLQGLSPPLTFVAGQPHTVDCWFTFKVENGVPSMANNSQMTCKNGQISAP